MGLRASRLAVAGAFHSPLMEPAADGMRKALSELDLEPLTTTVYSNVTGEPHPADDAELLKERLIEQLTSPVRWAENCSRLAKSLSTVSDEDERPAVPEEAVERVA